MPKPSAALRAAWIVAVASALGVRAWNALAGPLLTGYDAWGHLAYVLYLDLYRALPWPDQGWSTFHPPLHYAIGWALAQLGSSEWMVRGMALVGSAASLGIAWLAAGVARAASPGAPWAGLVAFVAVAFLPVHVYASPMIGNELTAAFLAAAGLALLVANERRGEPSLARDAASGALLGLALLAKLATASVLVACVVAIAWRGWRERAPGRAARRAALLAAVALLLASPFYARAVREYGTPLRMGRDNPLERRYEAEQPPGSRSWRDLVSVSPRLLLDPDPLAPHLIHSIWGSAYVHAWTDARAGKQHTPSVQAGRTRRQRAVARSLRERLRRVRSAMMWLGLVPTGLAIAGALLALRDVRRGRRSDVYAPLFACSALTLLAFAAFAYRVPTFAALKASYLLGLSLPWGAFTARACEALAGRGRRWPPALAGVALTLAAVGASSVHAAGAVLPVLGRSHLIGSLRLHFGELEAARAFFAERAQEEPDEPAWSENLATVALQAGDLAAARELYARHLDHPDAAPSRRNGLAVATALAGDSETALALLDETLVESLGATALVNRGVLLAARGELAAAERDLRGALEREPELVAGWHALAEVLALAGRGDEAAAARERGARQASRAPRARPYGLGDNLGHLPVQTIGRRWLLWLEGGVPRLARPDGRGPAAGYST